MRIAVVGFDWDVLFQRFQQLSAALAREHRVVYWCSADSWLKQVHTRRLSRLPVIRRLPPGLTVVSIPKLLPGRLLLRCPELDAIQTYLQSMWFADFSSGAGYDAVVLGSPTRSAMLFWERVPARMKIYDCFDENAHFFPADSEEHHDAVRAELRILRQADFVLASAERLRERLNRCHRRVALIPNGVEAAHFALREGCPVPEELARISKPILGFVGAIERWVDLALVAQVADALPEYMIVMVGPVACDVSDLTRRPNVILTGPRDYHRLPGYLHRFSVCMIPFRLNELTKAVDPVKFYEYCAAGKPVVSTPLPTMVARRDLVAIAEGASEFARRVRELRASDTPELRQRRVEFAERNSWQARAETITAMIRRMKDD